MINSNIRSAAVAAIVLIVLIFSSCGNKTNVTTITKKIGTEERFCEDIIFADEQQKDTLCYVKVFLTDDSVIIFKSKKCNLKLGMETKPGNRGGGFTIQHEQPAGFIADKDFRYTGKITELPQELHITHSVNAQSTCGQGFIGGGGYPYTIVVKSLSNIDRIQWLEKMLHDSHTGTEDSKFVYKQTYAVEGLCEEVTTTF
jgi:hypothetical protein